MSLPWHNLGAKPPWAREKNIGQKVNHEQQEGAGPNRDQSGSPVFEIFEILISLQGLSGMVLVAVFIRKFPM